jgi:predicted Na+-dependent transporter
MFAALRWLADKGPWVLVAGIIAGVALPSVARALVPYIPHMVAGLLFFASLRIGPVRMREAFNDWRGTLAAVCITQLLFPLIVLSVLGAFGWLDSPFALALVIIAMAPSISGAPNMVLMMGYDLATAMRFLVAGTALLPLTVIPVLYFVPSLGSINVVIAAATRLLLVIFVAGGAALLIRHFWKEPSFKQIKTIDGVSALLMAVVVIGLMSAVSEAIWQTPRVFAAWLAFVLIVNFGLQLLAFTTLKSRAPRDITASLTVIAGNRNIALFLVALPETVTAPLLVFIGCYQIPMYLTPLVTGRLLKGQNL